MELRFISEGKFSSLPDDASGKLMLKRQGAYVEDPLAASLGWVKSGSAANTIYTFSLNLNTVRLNSALTGDTIELALEVEWSHGNTIQSSLPVSVVVARDYIQDSEGIPEEAIDLKATQAEAAAGANNEKWVSPLRAWDAIRAWADANFNWTNLVGKPSAFAPSAHNSTHATGGADPITPAQIGAATADQGDRADSALQTGAPISDISGLQTALDGKQPSGSYAPASGIAPNAISGTAVVDADPRLTDSRQPTAHQSSHATGGADALTPADIGAATSAQGARADSALQPAALAPYIGLEGRRLLGGWAAESLEIGQGTTADLFVSLDGKVGVGTESPTEKLAVNGNIDLLEGQVKNLGAPVADTDAATKGFVDTSVVSLQTAIDVRVDNEASRAQTAESTLQSNIDAANAEISNEISRAQSAESNLQSNIDAANTRVDNVLSNIDPADIGAVKGFEISGNLPDPNIAPAAMELRDNEDPGGVALKCDGTLNNQWSVLFPASFRAAIGAPVAIEGYSDVASRATALFDIPHGSEALKIYESQVILAGEQFDLGGELEPAAALKKNFRAAINTVRRRFDADGEGQPDGAQGSVDQALQLWDAANGATALSIYDGEVSFGPDAEALNVAANFRAAIGAASAAQGAKADTSLQQGAYISAASLEVGSIAAGQTADLYVGQNGKVGVGTETPTEKLTVAGNIDLLEGQIKNLGTPVADTDAATKGFVDTAVAGLTPAAIGAVNGYGVPPDANVAPAAMQLLDEENRTTALSFDNSADGWFVQSEDSFRAAIGAAPLVHGHFQPNSDFPQDAQANALVEDNIAVKESAHLYNLGGLRNPRMVYNYAYNYDLSNSVELPQGSSLANRWSFIRDGIDEDEVLDIANQEGGAYPWSVTYAYGLAVSKAPAIRLVGAPLAATASEGTSAYAARADHVHALPTPAQIGAATKGYVDGLIPQAPPTGTYTLRSVDGVVSWVEA
jgi:hypothetical protein